MVYLWAFIALSLLVVVIVLAVALSKKSSHVRELLGVMNRRTTDYQRLSSHVSGQATAAIEASAQVQKLQEELLYSETQVRAQFAEKQRLKSENERLTEQSRERSSQNTAIAARAEVLEGALREAEGKVDLLQTKYGRIIDIDAEVARLKEEVRDLGAQRKELRQIEADLTMADVGLYKPQYDWKDSSRYKLALEALYKRHKDFVKAKKATVNEGKWVITGIKSEDARLRNDLSKLALRAFNAECEASVANVRWNNFDTMKRRIERAFEQINKLTSSWFLSISREYLALWIEELVLTHEHKEQIEREKEEQRRINERIREEEKAQRELDRAKERAEEDEERAKLALEKARLELKSARAEDAARYGTRISELEAALREAHEKAERAISRAQMTKAGYVYIISNIGSFGDDVFKVGMTRREDPNDRIRELGDASVPFVFDVHGMIFSEDAPKLEADLHRVLAAHRINLVNERKEFFRVPIKEIVEACKDLGQEVELTLLAEAKEFRQTAAMRRAELEVAGRATSTRSSLRID